MSLISDKKIVRQEHDQQLIDEDPLGQAKFVHLFKVTALNLHAIMMKPEIKLIIRELKQTDAAVNKHISIQKASRPSNSLGP